MWKRKVESRSTPRRGIPIIHVVGAVYGIGGVPKTKLPRFFFLIFCCLDSKLSQCFNSLRILGYLLSYSGNYQLGLVPLKKNNQRCSVQTTNSWRRDSIKRGFHKDWLISSLGKKISHPQDRGNSAAIDFDGTRYFKRYRMWMDREKVFQTGSTHKVYQNWRS